MKKSGITIHEDNDDRHIKKKAKFDNVITQTVTPEKRKNTEFKVVV